MPANDAVIVSAVRTPVGIGKPEKGVLSAIHPVDLSAVVLREVVRLLLGAVVVIALLLLVVRPLLKSLLTPVRGDGSVPLGASLATAQALPGASVRLAGSCSAPCHRSGR